MMALLALPALILSGLAGGLLVGGWLDWRRRRSGRIYEVSQEVTWEATWQVTVNEGSYFRGRPMIWDPDRQAIELERQRWVMEQVGAVSTAIAELSVDPDQAYRVHRAAYEQTGDLAQLQLALQYVRP